MTNDESIVQANGRGGWVDDIRQRQRTFYAVKERKHASVTHYWGEHFDNVDG